MTSPKVCEETLQDSSKGIGEPGDLPRSPTEQSLPPPSKAQGFHERYCDGLVMDAFPRKLSAADVHVCDENLMSNRPLLSYDESVEFLAFTLQEWGLGGPDEAPRRQRSRRYDEAARRGLSSLIRPPGKLEGDQQKFICVFLVGLEDDDDFCLVKRILGQAGTNMRRIADDCNAKVRLRGIGSGFLEGSQSTEANMPLQLNVSCTDYIDYVAAVDQVSRLLKDLYKHYRRYARCKGMEPPDANRTPAEQAEDKRLRDDEHRRRRLMPHQIPEAGTHKIFERLEKGTSGSDSDSSGGGGGGDKGGSCSYGFNTYSGAVDDEWRTRTLPSGAPMPMTPAGRRAAAREGGAAVAAAVSAAAREAERERKRRTAKEKAAKSSNCKAPLGMGLVTRSAGDAQQLFDGQLPIGANTASQYAVPKGSGKGKLTGRGRRGGRKRRKPQDSQNTMTCTDVSLDPRTFSLNGDATAIAQAALACGILPGSELFHGLQLMLNTGLSTLTLTEMNGGSQMREAPQLGTELEPPDLKDEIPGEAGTVDKAFWQGSNGSNDNGYPSQATELPEEACTLGLRTPDLEDLVQI